MIDTKNFEIRAVTAVAAPGCNLKCSYCELAKAAETPKGKLLWENNKKAILDGTYINNIKKTLDRLGQPIPLIDHFEIWGQEPTLILPFLTEVWRDWANVLCGIKRIYFSTNGMVNSDVIFDFMKKVDSEATRPTQFGIQLSYDGDYAEEEARGGISSYLIDNFVKLEDNINRYHFKHIDSIDFHIHATVPVELLDKLQTLGDVIAFLDDYEENYVRLTDANNSKIVQWGPPNFVSQNCYQFTSDQGIKYENLARMVNLATKRKPYRIFGYSDDDFGIQLSGCGVYDIVHVAKDIHCSNFDEYVDIFLDPKRHHPFHDHSATCSASLGELKIMYDGTFLLCQNLMFDLDKTISKDSTFSEMTKYHFMTKGQVVNGITSTDEEFNRYFEYMQTYMGPSRLFHTFVSAYNLMYLLAKCGEIDKSYLEDTQKLKRHAFIFCRMQNCPYNCQVLTGSSVVRSSGDIKQFCNGIADRLDRAIDTEIRRIQGEDHGCGCEL